MAERRASRPGTDLKQGDIYFVSLDPTAGHEQRGLRPVFVVTSRVFNHLTNAPLVAPITTGGGFARRNNFAVDLSGAGTKTVGVVRCDQIRVVDLLARGARYVESAPRQVTEDVLKILNAILAMDRGGPQ
jgi:mRNA-degrading endonuclease toxin of MazEF toxin-antitoxin module